MAVEIGEFIQSAWQASIRGVTTTLGDSTSVLAASTEFMEIFYFEHCSPQTGQIQRFLHAHPDSVVMVGRPPMRVVDVYAQSIFDAAPVAANDIAWDNNEDFALLGRTSSYLEFAFELDRRFGKRRLEQKFVVSFKHCCRKLAESWEQLTEDTPEIRHRLALDTLLRLFFASFLEARGILDGRSHFMIEEAQRCCEANGEVYRDFLQPLFFETLNRAAHRRTRRVHQFGRIPFLNGGLFTPGVHEIMSPGLTAPNDVWLEILTDLFGQYAVTTHHTQENHTLLLDPLMLGHVFETLMRRDARGATGSYYTPIPMARQVVLDVFIRWFRRETSLSQAQIEAVCLHDVYDDVPPETAREIESRLSALSVLDPAAGSGSFLQCVLKFLHRVRTGLQKRFREPDAPGALARQILSRNLYGVDIIPAARQICELRLWLELMHYFDRTDEIPPLPNLDMNIHCGDAIVECGQLAGLPGVHACSAAQIQEIRHLKQRYRLSTGPTKKKLAIQLENKMQAMSGHILSQMIDRCDETCRQMRSAQKTLFGDPGLTPRERRHIEVMESQKEKLRNYLEFGLLPGFSFEIQYCDILEHGGFDMVVGNPPWFSLHRMPEASQSVIRALYQTANPIRGTKAQSMDVSAVFIEKAIRCVKHDGLIGMIVPNKLFSAPSYESFRNHIASHAVILDIRDWSHSKCNTFAASAYPATLLMCRSEIRPVLFAGGSRVRPHDHSAGIRTSFAEQATLGDYFTVKRGVCTGANDIFLATEQMQGTDGCFLTLACEPNPVGMEPELVHPALRGSDIRAFSYRIEREMLFTHEFGPGMPPLRRLPPLAAQWFERHRQQLSARRGLGGKCLHTLFGVSPLLTRPRVVWRDIAPKLEACYIDDPRIIPLNTVYYIPVASKEEGYLLAAYLNSSSAREFCSIHAEHAQNNYRRFFAWVVQKLPWQPAATDHPEMQEIIALSKECHETGQISEATSERLDALFEKCFRDIRLACA